MKIEYTSRTSVIIEHNGKKARFLGDLGSVGFRAFANSMTWLLPHSRNELATEDEIEEVMKAVNLHFKGKKDSVFFVDNEGNKLRHGMETVKISGTKWYIDVEYKGQIARFGGDICLDGFAATVSSMGWIRHIGSPHDGEKEELMRAVYKYSKTNKKSRVRFYDDNGNEIKFD